MSLTWAQWGLGTLLSTLQSPALPTQNNQEECSHCQGGTRGEGDWRAFCAGKVGKGAEWSQGH